MAIPGDNCLLENDQQVSPVDEADVRLSSYCKALAHPTRVRILRILMAQEACLCSELVETIPLAQSTISQHLKILKQGNLIEDTVDGTRRRYCVSAVALEELGSLVAQLDQCCHEQPAPNQA